MMRWKIGWLVTTLTSLNFISMAIFPSNTTFTTTIQNESYQHADELSKITINNNIESDIEIGDENSTKLIYSAHVENVGELDNVRMEEEVKNDKEEQGKHARSVHDPGDGESDENKPKIVIETTFGSVQGHSWLESDEIMSYLDIPYGKFNLFEAPSDPDKWDIIHDIVEHNVRCPQLVNDDYVGIQDCLTLSVFVPKNAENAGVLFYIHESHLKNGSGDPSIYGPEYIVQKGIILVLPNYRLGPLGFLCLQNKTAPGNAALKDLTLALNWTKNNIVLFGGDPTNIVVSGDGTSAALAGYLALSLKSRNYISKVISDSGSMLSHWAIDREPINTASTLANQIRTVTEKDQQIEDIFSDIDIKSLITASGYITFKPCVEKNNSDSFIELNPWTIVINDIINLTFIIGSASHAGLREAIRHDNDALRDLNENFGNALPNDLVFKEEETKQNVVKKVKEQYFGTENISSSNMVNFSLYNTDISYQGPDLRIAKALVKAGSTVFLYEFSFMGNLNKELQTIDSKLHYGATRGDMVGYLFTQDSRVIDEENSKENEVIKLLTNMWVSFIQTGRPTAENIQWNCLNKTSDSDDVWLSIGEEVTSVTGFHPDRLDLWTEIYNEHFIDGNMAVDTKAIYYGHYVAIVCLVKLINSFLF